RGDGDALLRALDDRSAPDDQTDQHERRAENTDQPCRFVHCAFPLMENRRKNALALLATGCELRDDVSRSVRRRAHGGHDAFRATRNAGQELFTHGGLRWDGVGATSKPMLGGYS